MAYRHCVAQTHNPRAGSAKHIGKKRNRGGGTPSGAAPALVMPDKGRAALTPYLESAAGNQKGLGCYTLRWFPGL